MDKQFIVIVYDISNDKRRTKLHDKLKDFGVAVQYSVFECLLDNDDFKEVKKQVNAIIRKTLDHVRFYILCAACQNRIEVTGRQEITRDENAYVV